MAKRKKYISNLAQDDVRGRDLPKMIFIKVTDAYKLLWERNPKLHNIGDLIQSFDEHGFQEFPKYDAVLGALKAGNGRVEALYLMEQDGQYAPPRGVGQTPDGSWVMPITVGTDAKSIELAMSYAIDSNNIPLTGGNFTAFDMTRIWNEDEIIKMGVELAAAGTFPVTMDGDTVDALIKIGQRKESISGFLDNLPDVCNLRRPRCGDLFRFSVPPEVVMPEGWGDFCGGLCYANVVEGEYE